MKMLQRLFRYFLITEASNRNMRNEAFGRSGHSGSSCLITGSIAVLILGNAIITVRLIVDDEAFGKADQARTCATPFPCHYVS
jgi:hypothetical protein